MGVETPYFFLFLQQNILPTLPTDEIVNRKATLFKI